ncbi:dienelactone hydrolase family protein [Luteibacter sp. 9135]|uniref:dienelactone hydrolase family protein n=1 Tax=Luteibacter sp. 9135 TaxID=1500893 RepID=UPI00055C2F19|nr:dienelactone hydrolase family protein [Luteibacter sp. 9135]
MHEQAHRFGRARHLVGIAGVPAGDAGDIGVIVLNAGLVHRIGPFRLHVELTRQLNAAGYPTLRFDMSTLGDSAATGGGQTRVQQVLADLDDAMGLLASQAGCSRFVLVGLCSGAQNAHVVAAQDPRVAGAVFLDGYAYRTLGYRLRHYLPRLADPARWLRRFRRRGGEARAAARAPEPVFAVAPAPRAEVIADFTGMVARGMRLYLVYSGGISDCFNHARQFRECFGKVMRHPAVATRYLAGTDHTYVLTGDRARLVHGIDDWLTHHFPPAAAGRHP